MALSIYASRNLNLTYPVLLLPCVLGLVFLLRPPWPLCDYNIPHLYNNVNTFQKIFYKIIRRHTSKSIKSKRRVFSPLLQNERIIHEINKNKNHSRAQNNIKGRLTCITYCNNKIGTQNKNENTKYKNSKHFYFPFPFMV